jgi:hypothetical protein
LKRIAAEVNDQKLTIRNPKSGKSSEVVFIPKKLADRWKDNHQDGGAAGNQRTPFQEVVSSPRALFTDLFKSSIFTGLGKKSYICSRMASMVASRVA